MNESIIAGGGIHFAQNAEKLKLRRAQIRVEVEARHAEAMTKAGIFGRWWIRRKIRKEVAVLLSAEFPGAHALYLHR